MQARLRRPAGSRAAARAAAPRGFTLIEVLLVAGILVMLAAIIVPNMLGADEQAKIRATKANVSSYVNMFKQYKYTYDQDFPQNGFSALVSSPNIPGFKPLLENPNPVDPWGRPYHYEYPTQKNQMGEPAVWSDGPRQDDPNDDINSWSNAAR